MPPQQEIEMILARQLASYLVMPIFVVDPAGTLVFYNETHRRSWGAHCTSRTGAGHCPGRAAASAPCLLDPWPG